MYLHKYISPLQKPLTKEENIIRETSISLSKDEDWAVKIVSKEMASFVSKNSVLVPIPSSKGIAINNLKLVKAISAITHCEINDILISNPRESQKLRRRSGVKGYKVEDIKTSLKHPLPYNKEIIMIDNIRVTGATIDSAFKVLPNASYLVYAQGDEILWPKKEKANRFRV